MRLGRIKWTPAELAFVEANSKCARSELHAGFIKKFGKPEITLSAIAGLCKRNGWHTDGESRNKGKSTVYSDTELKWLEDRKEWPRAKLHAKFMRKFGHVDLSFVAFNAIVKNRGWTSGIVTRFAKGSVPANKGKPMSEEQKANPSFQRTQFKKGSRSGVALEVYKPIGTERVHENGYLERKIHDGLPMQSRWNSSTGSSGRR